MSTKGVDYSWGRPGGAAIAAAGFTFVMRYMPYAADGGKGLRADEVADLRANGLAIGLAFESTAGRMFDGYPAGAADAATCVRWLPPLGFPADQPIYFACDVDTEPAMLALVDDYLQGCASVLGAVRVGVYGEYEVVAHCQASGTAAWLWQTYAWSGGRLYAFAHIYQHLNGQTLNGAAVDYNEAYSEDFGQWKVEKDDMTPDEVLALSAGQFLTLLRQAIGVDDSTFSDQASVAAIRTQLTRQGVGPHKHRTTQQTITTGEVIE